MKSRRTAIVGAAGQLGSELAPLLSESAVPLSRADFDLTDAAAVQACLDQLQPELVVNCAAYNLVDRAEDEPEHAFAVNAFGVRRLARWCGSHDVPLMHISSDYVFGLPERGGPPWRESDLPLPLSVYGASKLTGEHFLQAYCPRHWIVRTCGLYGRRATRAKSNFVETMLRLGRERGEVRVVNDQRCTPTSAADLAALLSSLLQNDAYGLYHATNSGDCTWCEFAAEIFRQAGMTVNVVPITSAEFGAKARRPSHSVLDTTRLTNVLGQPPRPWQTALADYLAARPVQ